jgi:hypothetical protein
MSDGDDLRVRCVVETTVSTPTTSFSTGLINRTPNRPFQNGGSLAKILGCYYTSLVLSTCIELKDHKVISIGALRSA